MAAEQLGLALVSSPMERGSCLQLSETHMGQCWWRVNHSRRQAEWNRCLQNVFTTSSPTMKLRSPHSERQTTQDSAPNSIISGTKLRFPSKLSSCSTVGLPGGTTIPIGARGWLALLSLLFLSQQHPSTMRHATSSLFSPHPKPTILSPIATHIFGFRPIGPSVLSPVVLGQPSKSPALLGRHTPLS